MSFVGEATGVFGLLEKAWNLLRDRLDPARAQAKRLIETFEAYGIARQQIPRLLPAELKLPNAAFSTPDKLKDKLTPELLDWTAGHLAISRSWLDHVSRTPHLIVDHYKATSGYRDWLSKRLEIAPNVHRFLFVWKPLDEDLPTAHGPLCLIYQEISDGLDGAAAAGTMPASTATSVQVVAPGTARRSRCSHQETESGSTFPRGVTSVLAWWNKPYNLPASSL